MVKFMTFHGFIGSLILGYLGFLLFAALLGCGGDVGCAADHLGRAFKRPPPAVYGALPSTDHDRG